MKLREEPILRRREDCGMLICRTDTCAQESTPCKVVKHNLRTEAIVCIDWKKGAFARGLAMSAVGVESTSANTVELESTPLDHSGTLTI